MSTDTRHDARTRNEVLTALVIGLGVVMFILGAGLALGRWGTLCASGAIFMIIGYFMALRDER